MYYLSLIRKDLKTICRCASSTCVGREKLVILGVGWGGFRIARDIDKEKYDVTIISPRNHFLFTPLLPSTAVGTLEFRCVQEPIRTIKKITYYHAAAEEVDFNSKTVSCVSVYGKGVANTQENFTVEYDKLVIGVGTKSNTFGIQGIQTDEENVIHNPSGTNKHNLFFLKQLEHARAVRNRIIECFERAASPFTSEEEKQRLLTFLIVGGGPTSIEFASELYDLLHNDVVRWYPELADQCQIIVVEAGKSLLGAFSKTLSAYVEKKFAKRNIKTMVGESVAEVRDHTLILKSGKQLPYGACVWSTGNKELDFVGRLDIELSNGRILTDSHLRVMKTPGVYAIGDCAVISGNPLPMLAQVANQQGMYLAKVFNKGIDKPFKYVFLGSMAQLGTFDGVIDTPGTRSPKVKGIIAFLSWRAAYWTYSVSISNKILIPMYWFKSYWFGRDISKF